MFTVGLKGLGFVLSWTSSSSSWRCAGNLCCVVNVVLCLQNDTAVLLLNVSSFLSTLMACLNFSDLTRKCSSPIQLGSDIDLGLRA